MARLPTRDSLGALPSVPRRQITRISPVGGGDEIARGLVNFGKALGAVGATIHEHERRQDEFEAERAFHEFSWNESKALDERMRNMQPGQARGFADGWANEYAERAKEFKKAIPEHLKDEYDNKLFGVERRLYGPAQTFARTEQKRFSVAGIQQTRENVFLPRARTVPTEELDSVTADDEALILANPDLSPIEKDELIREGRRKIGLSHLDGLPPEKARAIVQARIHAVEGTAKNPESSAEGHFQFIESTWLDMIQRKRPDLMAGRSRAEVLELRKDKKIASEMEAHLRAENTSALQSAGLPVNSGTQYLAHFLGSGGAVAALKANPNMGIREALVAGGVPPEKADKMIAANKSILEGKTAGEVAAWANRKMGSSALMALNDEDWIKAGKDAETRERAEILDRERVLRVQAAEEKRISDAEEIEIARMLADPAQRESVTATSIANNKKLTREAIQRNLALVDRSDKTDNTYGAKFYELFQRTHLPEGDPNRITSVEQIVPFVTQGGGLTLSGYNQIVQQIRGKGTPDAESESKMLSQFMKVAHDELSGTNPLLGIKDPKGEEINLRFMAQILPQYYKLRGQGKTPAQLLDPDSPEYLGKGIKTLKRPYNEQVRDMLGSLGTGAEADTSTAQGLITAVQSGKISRAEGEKIALERGWIRPAVNPPMSH